MKERAESMSEKARETTESVDETFQDFAANLKHTFPQKIARYARDFKKHMLGSIRRELPPRRGRPHNPRYDQAAQMAQQGKTRG